MLQILCAFAYKQLTHVVLPKALKTIRKSAFRGNYFTNVVIPNSVRIIGKYAFADNRLQGIIIPMSVDTIDDMAFRDNEIRELVIPKSVKRIGSKAFIENRLTTLILKPPALIIGRKAFVKNNFEVITLHASVYEFYKEKSQNIFLGKRDNQNIQYTFLESSTSDSTTTIKPTKEYDPSVEDDAIQAGTYNHKSGLGTVYVVSISNTNKFKRVLHIKSGTKTIPDNAFNNEKITEVFILNSVRSIGKRAFYWNDLTTLTIPVNVKTIGEEAFAHNILREVDFALDAAVRTIARKAFYQNSRLDRLYLSEHIQSIGASAFEGCPIDGIDIPSSLKYVGINAFKGHNIPNIRFVDHDAPITMKEGAFMGRGSSMTHGRRDVLRDQVSNKKIFETEVQPLNNVYMPKSLFKQHKSRLTAIFGNNHNTPPSIQYRDLENEEILQH